MLYVFLALLATCCLLCFISSRYWLGSILCIGFLQDVFRKLVPNEPVYFVVIVGFLFAVVFASQLFNKGLKQSLEPFTKWTHLLYPSATAFVVILFLQYLNSLFTYGSIVMSTIGLVSYSAPLFAIIIGYFSVTSIAAIRQFVFWYSIVGVILAMTVFLSFFGVELQIFKEVGAGLKIYDQGTVLRSFSGFMRTGEIAAWHMAASACFMIILASTSDKRSVVMAVLVTVLVFFFVVAISFTGRRKMIMLISLFSLSYLISYLYYRRTLNLSYMLIGLISGLIVWWLIPIIFPSSYDSDFSNYLARGSSVYGDASSRFIELGLSPVNWAIDRVGLLGGGLGIASQGSKLFGSTSIAGGSGEGGLGKIVVELGVPGLLIILWFVYRFAFYLSKILSLTSQRFVPNTVMPLMVGIATFLAVNALTFSVATQVYGDIFILLILGMLIGFLFVTPKLILLALNFNQMKETQLKNTQTASVDMSRT